MSKEKRRVPKLRFPGFTEDWEQRKADYIFKSVTDKGYPELPVLSASQELGMVYREQNGIDIQHDKKNEASYKRVLPGQFVIHLRSFQGGFAYSEIEGITSPAYTVMSFKNSNEQYGLFWKHIFKSETFIKRLETITYGIRDGRSISFSDFKSLILLYPSFSEQKMIGDSIAIIEIGITLHQRKLEHLNLKKKALLQKLFPKNGERYPELRFPGFTDAWEQRKLSDILKVNSGKDYKHLDQGNIPVYGTGGYMLSVNESLSNIDAIGIGRKGTIDKPQYLKAPFWTVDTLFYLTALDKHSILFLYYLMQLIPWKKFDESTGVPSLSKTTIDNISGFVPSNSQEEELISALFNQLDKCITLHQRKLDHLQLQKKALLQQMFV